MLERILLPLDPSPQAEASFKYARSLAKIYDAEITGFMILDAPEIERSVSRVTPGALEYARKAEKRREALAHEHIREQLTSFAETCEEDSVRHTEVEVQGNPAEMIIGKSVFYDLVIMAIETHYNFETSEQSGDSLKKIAGHMMPPLIAVPLKPYDPGMTGHVTIAFGGSPAAARSVRQFVNLGIFKDAEVTILCSNPDMEVGNELIAAVSMYLRSHGYENIAHEWTPGPVIEAMRDQYLEQADLIVLGAHGKHGILSFFYGKVTEFVLEQAETPVFIAN